ncbi:hypothetical protein FOB58_003080 [Candida parapsilosis]|uniref:Uncharacterized protein n=1 Tax=Candida parapsilosis TaxID=5480 RepID=A0A8X7TC60_CANPA|nr:hypothetical protein FOB59_003273 [Candida parapsilosis]KAF6049803.1 hypothetical protein FOB58_003080 [Candida parapsilosis]KAF6057666.1 hypothetical protein FOB60_002221 [Candida parapsilosis]KAF6065627.1 hypothetical protein FOB61_001697 [Candida parapsilosis]
MTNINGTNKTVKINRFSSGSHNYNSALATWKKLKSAKSDPKIKTQVDPDDVTESDATQELGTGPYLVENGPQGELFVFYLQAKVLEIWDWGKPNSRADRDTLYLQSRLKTRSSFNILSFKVLMRKEESYIVIAVVSENDVDNVYILSITSALIDVASSIVLPFSSKNYSIKGNSTFVCIGTDSGAIHVYRFDGESLVLRSANINSALSNIKRNCCNIPGRTDVCGDENLLLQTSCSDGSAIFDIIEGWLVYCPTKSEYTYLKDIKRNDNNRKKTNTSKKDQSLNYQDPIITNLTSQSVRKQKASLFTPVKLSGSTPLYHKVMSSVSKTTLDGIFKVSELSSAKYKEYMENKLELNNIGKSIGKTLYTNLQKSSEFLKPNDNQILSIVDIVNDQLLATFKPSGGVSSVSFSQYDLQLATSNLRGDSLYVWDLYRLPTEISLVGKFCRGNTSAIVKNIFWFNTEDDNHDTHSGLGCITKATGSVHWYDTNSLLGESKAGDINKKAKRSRKGSRESPKNDWTLSAFEGDKFLNVLDKQIAVLTKTGRLKMINPANGHHYYEFKIPHQPTAAVFSNPDVFPSWKSGDQTRPRNPLAQAEIETCAPYLNLINCKNVEFATYQYEHETFNEFGNDMAFDSLNVRSMPPAKTDHFPERDAEKVTSKISALSKIYIDQGDEDEL